MSQSAKYTTDIEWPIDMLARYQEVISYPGVHYTITSGTQFASDPAVGLLPLPKPIYDGYVFRVFMYAGDNSEESFTGVRYKTSGYIHWTIRIGIEGGVAYVFTITNKQKADETKSNPMGTVNVGDIYTISMVAESDKHFHANLNDRRIGTLEAGTIRGNAYDLWHGSRGHTVLSMHFSRESGTETNLGDALFLTGFKMLHIGSYVTLYGVFNPTAQEPNLEVYIKDREAWKEGVKWTYKPQSQALGDGSFTCSVRRIPSNYVVLLSFQSTPEVVQRNQNHPEVNRLEVSFSSNVRQVRAHYVIPF